MPEIEKLDGDLFWDYDDAEMSFDDPEEWIRENVQCSAVVRFQMAKSLPDVFGAQRYNVDKDEYETKFFTTAEEAEKWKAKLTG